MFSTCCISFEVRPGKFKIAIFKNCYLEMIVEKIPNEFITGIVNVIVVDSFQTLVNQICIVQYMELYPGLEFRPPGVLHK